MISLITDMFVIYHAKGLKLTHSEAEGKGGGEDGDEKAEKRKRNSAEENGADQEESEPLEPTALHVHNISCAPPSYEEKEESEGNDGMEMTEVGESARKAASLPRDAKPSHRRNASKDISGLLLPDISPSEFEAIRKTSSHHPIAEF